MPNDPRVKFHKGGKVCKKDIEYLRKHPECRLGHRQLLGGEGGGGRGLRSIYEDEDPPPDTGGGGEFPGGGTGGGATTRATEIPQAEKPSLNAGEITGATIGSIAATAAAIEATRRALEARERRRGMQPVPQQDQLRSRQSGVGGRRQRPGLARGIGRAVGAVSSGLNTIAQPAVEMMGLANQRYTQLQPTDVVVNLAMPPAPAAAAPAAAAPDLQRATTRQAPTAAPVPAPQPAAIPKIADTPIPPIDQLEKVRAEITLIESQMPTETTGNRNAMKEQLKILRKQAAALEKALPAAPATPAAPAPEMPKIPSPPRGRPRPERATYTSVDEGANKVVSLEPNERGIEMSAFDVANRKARSAVMDTVIESNTIRLRRAQMESQGKTQTEIEAAVAAIKANQAKKAVNRPFRSLEEEIAQRTIELENPNISEGRMKSLQSEINILEREIELTTRLEANKILIKRTSSANTKAGEYLAGDRPGISSKQKLKYYQGRRIYSLATLDKQITEIELKLLNPAMPQEERQALIAEQEKLRTEHKALDERYKANQAKIDNRAAGINKTTEANINTSLSAPANDTARATQPTQELETRLRPVEINAAVEAPRRRGLSLPGIDEMVQTLMDRALGRRSTERGVLIDPTAPSTTTNTAALQRARSSNAPLSTDTRVMEIEMTTEQINQANLEEGLKISAREAGQGYSGGEGAGTSGGVTVDTLRAEQQPQGQRQIAAPANVEAPRTGKGKGLAPGARERVVPPEQVIQPEQPREVVNLQRPPPEPMGEEKEMRDLRRPPPEPMGDKELGDLRFRDRTSFNEYADHLLEAVKNEGFVIPEPPATIEAQGELAVKKYQYEKAIEFTQIEDARGNQMYISEVEIVGGERKATGKPIRRKKALLKLEELYDKAIAEDVFNSRGAASRSLAEVRNAPAEVRAAPGAAATERANVVAPEARTMSAEARAAPEAMSARAASAPEAMSARAPEITGRRLSAAPELTARPAIEPTGRPVIEPTGRPAIAPIGEPAPSAPPSAPGSGTATPQEGATVERTPTERTAFAEELSAGLKGKKVPGRQKAKINSGIANKTSLNPLERFVAPQFRNAPNVEIHPSAKNLRGALSQLSSRVPTLVPSKKVLLSAGVTAVAEGGGAVTGFFAGSAAGKAMSEYFATHPPTNRTDEYGQALATSMVALGVGNVVSKAVTYAIRQGARVAMGASISGSISSAGAAGLTAIGEAALFATVATTTQFYVTKSLEDSGNSHAFSRTIGSIAATESLMYLEVAAWAAKGGIFNPAADLALIASEVFIIGFGIWSAFEEFAEGKRQDENEATLREEERLERIRAEQERRDTVATINRTNSAKAAFLRRLPMYEYQFDTVYALLSEKEKQDLGITSPETKLAFQRDIERAFDPFGAFQPSGDGGLVVDPPILSQVEKDRGEVMNSYINWYINSLRHVKQPPFDFNDPKVRELNEYSGGTWKSAAEVSANTNYLQSERVHPLIERAQNKIIDAFHNERKTIEDIQQMDPDTVRYATLDPTFRTNYEAYIIADAAAQILVEFNNTQSTYNQVDPALLAIADRDPNFRAAADAYYQVLANQARDYQLTISQVAHLNSLMENEQAIELGKLNEARNKIIEKNQSENQAMVDAYNANILREINIYGDNFEAIIRNINEQSLLSGHTFLYASNRADLYRQLHLEVPAIEFVDPVDEVEGERPDATWHQGKGRKAGDTAIYGYRYNLTDEQNQELEDMIANNQIARFDAEKQAIIIYNRDRAKFIQTDEEKAADLGLSLDAYYKKFGITDPTVISSEPSYSDLQRLYPAQYRDLKRKYADDPDADKKIEETLARTHTRRMEQSGGIYTPLEQAPDLELGTLQQMYPDYYGKLVKAFTQRDGSMSPEATKFIEISLRLHHMDQVEAGTAPPVPVENREPTYEELQVMYPEQFEIYNNAGITTGQQDKTEGLLRRFHSRRIADGTAPPIPTPDAPAIDPNLKNGIVNMPDGSTRTYKNGLVVNVYYGDPDNMKITDIKNAQEINAEEGVQDVSYTPKREVPTILKQGFVRMPDGSKRFYVDGKVVSVDYPEGVPGKTIKEINDEEGVKKEPVLPPNTADDPENFERPAGYGESGDPDAEAERQANADLQQQRIAGGGSADEFDRIVPGSQAGYGEGGDVQRPGTNQNGETIRQENDPDGP